MEASAAVLADRHRTYVARIPFNGNVGEKVCGDQWDVLKRLLKVVGEKFSNPDVSVEALCKEVRTLVSVIHGIGLDFSDEEEAGFECNDSKNLLPTVKNLYAVACTTIADFPGDRGQEVWNAFIEGIKEYVEDMTEIEGKTAGGTTPG